MVRRGSQSIIRETGVPAENQRPIATWDREDRPKDLTQARQLGLTQARHRAVCFDTDLRVDTIPHEARRARWERA